MATSTWPTVYGKHDKLKDLKWTRKTPGKCYIFLRSAAVGGLGHVGWAFLLNDGQYCFGGTENPVQADLPWYQQAWSSFQQGTKEQGGDNQAWNMIRPEKKMRSIMGWDMKYDRYKVITVPHPCIAKAWNQVLWNNKCGFTGLTNNCLDATHRVLSGYGAGNLPNPQVPTNYAPLWYFDHAPGKEKA